MSEIDKDTRAAADRARAEAARIGAETAETNAETAKSLTYTARDTAITKASEALASANNASTSESNALLYKNASEDAAFDALSSIGVSQQYFSTTIGVQPSSTGAVVGTFGAYFTSAFVLQKLEWNGASWDNIGIPVITVDSMKVDDVTALKALQAVKDKQKITLLGYYEAGDGGGGDFYWDAASVEADNTGTIFEVAGVATGRWKRLYSGAVNVKWFGATGDGITDDTQSILNSVNSGDYNIFLPTGNYVISSTITPPRRVKISGESSYGSGGSEYGTYVTVIGDITAFHLPNANCHIKGINITAPSKQANSIGILIGSAVSFTAYIQIENVTIDNFNTGIKYDNTFFSELKSVYIDDVTTGILISPTAGSGLGYTTTLVFNRIFIYNASQRGIYENSPIKNVNMSWNDIDVEQCGDNLGTYPQIEIGEQINFTARTVYIESTDANKPDGIKLKNGKIDGLYINGYKNGVDIGTGSANVDISNARFVSGQNSSIVGSGGSIASIAMRQCTFDTAPVITAIYQLYENCSGVLPAAISSNAIDFAGTKPLFGVGGNANSKIRDIEYYSFTENVLVAAGATQIGTAITASMLNSIVIATPFNNLPDGITYYTKKNNNTTFRNVYVNNTASPQTVTNLFIACVINFAT
jgi:hypothetical protein